MTKPPLTTNRSSRGSLPEKRQSKKVRLVQKEVPISAGGATTNERIAAAHKELENLNEANKECAQEKAMIEPYLKRAPAMTALFAILTFISIFAAHPIMFAVFALMAIWYLFIFITLKKAKRDYIMDEKDLQKEQQRVQAKVDRLRTSNHTP